MNDRLPKEEKLPFNPKLFPNLTADEWEGAIQKGHIECNEKLVKTVSATGIERKKWRLLAIAQTYNVLKIGSPMCIGNKA